MQQIPIYFYSFDLVADQTHLCPQTGIMINSLGCNRITEALNFVSLLSSQIELVCMEVYIFKTSIIRVYFQKRTAHMILQNVLFIIKSTFIFQEKLKQYKKFRHKTIHQPNLRTKPHRLQKRYFISMYFY